MGRDLEKTEHMIPTTHSDMKMHVWFTLEICGFNSSPSTLWVGFVKKLHHNTQYYIMASKLVLSIIEQENRMAYHCLPSPGIQVALL